GAASDGDREALVRRLAGLGQDERRQELLALVRAEAAVVLAHSGPEAVVPGRGFLDSGFDSLTVLDLRNRIATATGLRLSSTLAFDHPTPLALATHLSDRLAAAPAASAIAAPTGPLLAELDRFETAVGAFLAGPGAPGQPPGAGDRGQAVTRLRELLRRLDGPPAGDDVAGRLMAASAEEVLSFIDNELTSN
ncbi:MAG: acyl carrier protein, partial [Streptomyces sp.]|nr:acyl carrier protein [Streptomyces sp.]